MKYKTDSWKQKVDPAFDKFIKLYKEFLSISQLPGNEGYLSIDGNNLKKLEIKRFCSRVRKYGSLLFLSPSP
jgi:hypothetical protein